MRRTGGVGALADGDADESCDQAISRQPASTDGGLLGVNDSIVSRRPSTDGAAGTGYQELD